MEKLFEIMPLFYYDLASVVVFFTVFFTLKSRSKGIKYGAIYVMCALNLTFYLINDYYFYIGGSDVLTLLPAILVLYFYMGIVYLITGKKNRELTLPL